MAKLLIVLVVVEVKVKR